MPLRTDVPVKTALLRCAIVASAGELPGALTTGKGLAGQRRFADVEIPGFQNDAVGRNKVSCRKPDDVPRYEVFSRYRRLYAIAYHQNLARDALPERLHGPRRPIFLSETQQAACKHDQPDDGGSVRVTDDGRNAYRKDKDEYQAGCGIDGRRCRWRWNAMPCRPCSARPWRIGLRPRQRKDPPCRFQAPLAGPRPDATNRHHRLACRITPRKEAPSAALQPSLFKKRMDSAYEKPLFSSEE